MIKFTALTLLTLSVTFPQTYGGSGAAADPDPFAGQYELQADSSDDPTVAVEEAIRDLGRLARRRARGRLIKAVTPASSLLIEMVGDTCVITASAGATLRVVPNGEQTEHRMERDEVVRVSAIWKGDELVVTTHIASMEKTQSFAPIADGLRVEAVYTHSALPEPLRLVSTYYRIP